MASALKLASILSSLPHRQPYGNMCVALASQGKSPFGSSRDDQPATQISLYQGNWDSRPK